MKFFYLLVFGLVDGGLFGDLVVEEADVSLVFGGHELLFGLNFMERLVEVFDLFVIHLLSGLDSIHKLLDSRLSLLEPVNIVSLNSLKLFMLGLKDLILFSNKYLKLFPLSLHRVNNPLKPIFHLKHIIRMHLGQSLLQPIQLQLILTLYFIDLLF